ncbi:MAG: succinate dehydrogenase [Planctomycetota bacterium]
MRLNTLTQSLKQRGFAATARRDKWWLQPLATFLGFSTFIFYSTWAALQNAHYHLGNYLSPFYSPEIFGTSPHAWFPPPEWWPSLIPFSPAIFILWAPGGFRFTCYYYRGAYYKAFWGDPPGCAVGELRKQYLGEQSLPLILQNIHRYFLYVALVVIAFLAHDAWKAMWFQNADGTESFGVGIGTLVLTLNVVLLSGYTFGCHSLRHLIGGVLDRMSAAPLRKSCYSCVSSFNRAHAQWAWFSLFWVGFTDVYVRLCSMGYWTDWRLF